MTNIVTEVALDELITENYFEIITEVTDMSERYLILSKVIEVLEGITVANGYSTDVAYVSDVLQLEHPNQLDKNQYPACFPSDADEDKESATIGTSGDNMRSVLTIEITSIVYDHYGHTAQIRSDLIRDIEKAMVTSSTLKALLVERPSPTKVETDKGYFGEYSMFLQEFELEYYYNHAEGG